MQFFGRGICRRDPSRNALVLLVNHGFPTASLDRILYFHAAKADRLLYDVVTELLLPFKTQGLIDLDVIEVERKLAKWVGEGKTTGRGVRTQFAA